MRLFSQFIVRHLARERLRAGATVVGLALGIAVIVAIRIANLSSIRAFESAVDTVAGRTSLEIVSAGIGFDEHRLIDLAWLRRYGAVSPIIEGDALARAADGSGETLRVLGVDIVRDRPIRDYRVFDSAQSPDSSRPRQLLSLLLDPGSIVLTEAYARRHHLRVGDSVEFSLAGRIEQFRVRALLSAEGPARVLDGNFALMDIAAAQLAFDRLGYIDRVDIRLRDDVSVDRAEQEIAGKLPAGLTVQRPERRGRQVEKMLEAFQFNLAALSYIALLVGLFLIYNTIAISVIARREEIGTLRALGTSRRLVLGMFLGEAVLLAIAGCSAGVMLGPLLARAAVQLTSRTVNVLYVSAAATPTGLEWSHVALAFGVGIPLSLLAAALPAIEASRVPPTTAMRGSDRVIVRYLFSARQLIAPALLLILAWGLSTLGPVGGRPLFGFAAALALVFGGAFLVQPALDLMTRALRRPLIRLFAIEGRLAYSSLAGAIPRIAISVAALAVSLAMMVAVAVMVGSFRDTVIYWVSQTFKADLFIAPARGSRVGQPATLAPEVEQAVMNHPGVAAVDRFRGLSIVYGDTISTLGAGDFAVLLDHGNLLFKKPTDGRAALKDSIDRDAVLISESFAMKHRLGVGSRVDLPTPSGPAAFTVSAIYYDYSSDRGMVVMDRRTFARHYGNERPTSLSVYLKPGAVPDLVREELMSALGGEYRLFIHTNASLREQVLRIFDATFAITYALEAIAIFVAIMGVAGTMVTLMLERRRELAVLRLIGADHRQLRRMVLIEAGLIGAVGQGLGTAIGLLLSLVLIYVINVQSFGWTIQFHLPAVFLVQASALVLAATTASGVFPARFVSRLRPADEVIEE